MILKELILMLVALLVPDMPEVCHGTTFAQEGDKWLGGDSPVLRRKILPTDNGVAHREFPLGRWVRIKNIRTGKETTARVIDRGPFGRIHETTGRWYNGVEIFREANRTCKAIPRDGWRGCLDMTPRVAKAIGARGFEPVAVHLLPSRRKRAPNRSSRRCPHR